MSRTQRNLTSTNYIRKNCLYFSFLLSLNKFVLLGYINLKLLLPSPYRKRKSKTSSNF